MSEGQDALPEEQKEEVVSELKLALSGRVEGIATGISSTVFTIALARTGLIPLVPTSFSQLQLFGWAAVFAVISGLLYLYRTRPHNNRLKKMMQQWEDMEEDS